MSELSAYRLGAQNYIDAKKRGEIPPPPKHTLPGYKAKSETEPENKTTEESADSETMSPPPRTLGRNQKGTIQATKR